MSSPIDIEKIIRDALQKDPDFRQKVLEHNPDFFTKLHVANDINKFLHESNIRNIYAAYLRENKSTYKSGAPSSSSASSPIGSKPNTSFLKSGSPFSSASSSSPVSSGGGYSGKSSRCFIATVAYDSADHEDVIVLQQFRDTFLLTNRVGRTFVTVYYQLSPSLAHCVAKYAGAKKIIRGCLYPIVKLSRYLLK